MEKLTPRLLLTAYASGVFPMAESADSDEIFWFNPEMRGVMPLGGLHVSRSLRKAMRARRFKVTANQCFSDVMAACADREETWINPEITALYAELHEVGHAHSIEVWDGDTLAGGLYGVSLGAAFFGESMFSHQSNASKIALVGLVARLNLGSFKLLDMQFLTPHLASLGGVEISQKNYQSQLAAALPLPSDFYRLKATDLYSLLALSDSQVSTQMS
ncbi:MAG TPA: leucyl/phenylalanyl-tRNA--protein transferase [Rhodobacteraceae bacterium]|nr:leucyl/phenylalanyl-tRNA--protein transferase [Paracoccaceae bacterium]